jgi:hypothetical protein
MHPFTRKYQTGGKLDTNAMRDDVSKDGEFFRDGNYTQKGRRRLAAIQKVEDNQDRGLSYNIDDSTGSFEIVDALGRLDVNSGGHGIGSSERSGLLYGTFNKDKRSKREISSLMSGASKYIINDSKVVNNDDENKADIIPDSSTNSANNVIVDPAPTGGDKVPLTKDQEEAKVIGIDLSKGATAKVLSAQKRLKAAGFYAGPLDGIWGTNTQAAWNKAYPTKTAAKTPEQIEAEAKALIEAKEKPKDSKPENKVVVKEEDDIVVTTTNSNDESIASNKTISAEGLDNVADSPITRLDRIAEAGDIQEEINLRKSNGGIPSEDPRFKDRSVADLEMDKYDLVERGPVSTTKAKGSDIFEYNAETNTSTQGGTLFSGIGEGDVKGFLETDNIANQLFSSKYNKGIIDNSEKIKLYRDEIKSREDADYSKEKSPFAGEKTEDLNKKIKELNLEVSDSITEQVKQSYNSTVSYIKNELEKKEKELNNLKYTNASDDEIKQSTITRNALKSRVKFLEKKIDAFYDSGMTKKDYKDFYGDVVLSDDKNVMWDTTRNKVVDIKTRIDEIKKVAKGKSILSNVLKSPSWLKPQDRTKFKELLSNENLNKGKDGKGFDAQKMVDEATEEYILDVGFFGYKGTYKEDDGNTKSFLNYTKELGVKDIYKNISHLKTKYSTYVKEVSKRYVTPKESYASNTLPVIKSGESVEDFLKNISLKTDGTVKISSSSYPRFKNYLKSVGVTDSELRLNPVKSAWVYKHTLAKPNDKNMYKRLSKTWENTYGKNTAKYEKGGVLKFQSGDKYEFLTTSLDGRTYEDINTTNRKIAADKELARLNARRNQLNALKAADTPYKPEYSFKPQLNLGASNELDFNNYKKANNFFTTYKTPEQIKADKLNGMYGTSTPVVTRPKQVPANKITIDNSNLRLPDIAAKEETIVKDESVTEPATNPKTLGEKILSSIKNTRKFYTDSGNTGDYTEGNAPLFSRTGINTPLGEVQYNDLARYYLAKRARDRKVGDVKLNLKKHIDHGSKNVLAARDIDSAMLNEANREISKIGSGYKGSDPLMNAVFNKIAGEARNKAKMGLISKRSDFRSKEQARVFDDMNSMRAERSADNVRANNTRFANNQLKYEAELAKLQDKAARETKFDSTRGKILADLQGRANTNAAIGKNLITESESIDNQNRANLAEKRYKESYTAYQNALTNKLDPAIIDKLETQMDIDNNARNIDPYDRNKIIKDYDRINKGRSKLQIGNSIFKNLFGG